MSGILWQDEERSFPALKHPLWDYNDNVQCCLLLLCLDPATSPEHISILHVCIHLLGKKQFPIGYSVVHKQPYVLMFFGGFNFLYAVSF